VSVICRFMVRLVRVVGVVTWRAWRLCARGLWNKSAQFVAAGVWVCAEASRIPASTQSVGAARLANAARLLLGVVFVLIGKGE